MSKDSIRRQSGDFLKNLSNIMASFKVDGQDQFTTARDVGFDVDEVTEFLSLTGAAPALLPMRIATIGNSRNKDGTTIPARLEFTLLINPETWNHGKTNIVPAIYTRNGWVVQPWGPGQDTISSTGRTAAFILPALGISNFGQEMSFSYLNFLSLLSAYKNNGYEFSDFTQIHEVTRVVSMIRGIQISYDNNIYMGHFNTFTLDEDETAPFLFNYNFEFIISALEGSEYEVRGHYQKLPLSVIDLDTGTEKDPTIFRLVDDPGVRPQAQPKPLNAQDDSIVMKLWQQKTGLSWSDPARLKYSDGSFLQNVQLRQLLITKTWDATSKTFK